MRKTIMQFLIILVLFMSIFSQQKISGLESEVKDILKSSSPSIVKVISENHRRYIATGIAIERDMIITSTLITYHPYNRIYIKTVEGKSYPAKVIGKDRRYSTILLKLKDKVMTPIKKSTKLAVGDWIALVGVFYKQFPSIFQGIVSSISEDNLILNAPVFPGGSGGAVLNKKGELVAVIRGSFGIAAEPNLSIIDRNRGQVILRSSRLKSRRLCYAIPVQKIMRITDQLKKFGRVKRGWLGIYLASDRPNNRITIKSVINESPAMKAGLREGDILISINGKRIGNADDVTRIVRSLVPEKTVKIEFLRNKLRKRIMVKMGELGAGKYYERERLEIKFPEYTQTPELYSSIPKEKNFVVHWNTTRRLGVDMIELTTELANKFGVKESYGLMISKVHEKSSARKAGLLEGDIIVKASNRRVKNISDLHGILNAHEGRDAVAITFYRDKQLKSFDIFPDLVKKSQMEWNIFEDRVKVFSDYFYNRFFSKSKSSLSKQREKILHELKRLKALNINISKSVLRKIESTIRNLKRESKEMYLKELRKVQIEQNRIKEEMRRYREEEVQLNRELEKIKQQLEKEKETTKKDNRVKL